MSCLVEWAADFLGEELLPWQIEALKRVCEHCGEVGRD